MKAKTKTKTGKQKTGKSKRILVFCDFKGVLGDAIRISRITNFLSKQGHDVELCNVFDYRSSVLRVITRPAVWTSVLQRAGNANGTLRDWAYRSLCESVAKEKLGAREKRFDAVLAEGVIQGANIVEACAAADVPLFTDVHGLASAEYEENPFIAKKSVRHVRYLREAEAEAAHASAGLSVVSNPMGKYFEASGVSGKKIFVAMNGADAQKTRAGFRKPLKAVYGGIFAFWEDVDSYLDLAATDSKHEFVLAGGGPLTQRVEKRISGENIRVDYRGQLAREKMFELFAKTQVGLAPSADALARRVACPIKVFDYLSCGLPVVTPAFGEWAEIVEAAECGVVTKKSDAGEFKAALDALGEEKRWRKASKNALELIKREFNWGRVLEPLQEMIESD